MSRYRGGGSEYNALWRTLCADSFPTSTATDRHLEANFRRAEDEDEEKIMLWRKWLGKLKIGSGETMATLPEEVKGEERILWEQADAAVRAAVLERKVVRLEGGWIGLLSLMTNIGDEVVVLEGGRVPVVVRGMGRMKVLGEGEVVGEEERDVYAYMGECYIHGIMDGEIVSKGMGQAREMFLI
ncbi:hypothetical protein ACMFMF_009144 [Clarireedia jacksonii]